MVVQALPVMQQAPALATLSTQQGLTSDFGPHALNIEWLGKCWNQIPGRAVGLDDKGNGSRPAAIGPNHDTGTFCQAAQPPKRHRTAFASLYHAAAEIGSTVHVICRAASDSLHPGRLSRLIRSQDNPLVSSGRLQTHVCPSPGVRGFTVPLCLSHARLEVVSPQVTFPQQDPGTVESLAVVPQCLPVWLSRIHQRRHPSNNHGPSMTERLIAGLPMSSNAGPSGAQRPCAHRSAAYWGTRCVRGRPHRRISTPRFSPTLRSTPRNAGM
jgi:hypothetical protein